jgi:hypothetical protein
MTDPEAVQLCEKFVVRLKAMELAQLEIAMKGIINRLSELVVDAEEEIDRQRDQLLEAADVYVEDGRLPNLPAEKAAWADGDRAADPAGYWYHTPARKLPNILSTNGGST